MALPTLDQLLSVFRDHDLPQDVDPAFANASLNDVPTCSANATLQYRMLEYKDNNSNVTFIEPDKLTSSWASSFVNLDDSHYKRLLSATGGLLYQHSTGKDGGGGRITAKLEVCKKGAEVYATDRIVPVRSDEDILENRTDVPGIRDIDFNFRPEEIIAIVKGAHIDRIHYRVDPDDHARIKLFPDLTLIDRVIAFVQSPDSPIDADRKAPMVKALNGAVVHEREALETQKAQKKSIDEQLKIPPWMLTALGVLGGSLATVPIMVWMQRRNEKLMREMQQGPKVDTSKMFTDPTDSMRTNNAVDIPKSQERYVEAVRSRFNQGQFPHVVLSGPSGSGKSYTADLIGKLAVNGQLGVEGFQGQQVRFVRIDANDIIREAGSWQNGAQARFFEVLNQLTKETKGPIIIHLLEADKFAAAGQGPGNQPLNLLKELYTIMEGVNPQYRNVHFILDSTRWKTIQDAAPDMLRRAQFMEMVPPVPEDVRKALESGIESRRLRHKDDRIRQRFERITFSPEALDAIAALGEYRDGAPPSSHLSLIDQLAEEASQKTTGRMTITREHVVRLVARDKALPIAEVNTELNRRLGSEGVRQNPRIQSAILEGFYRAYPEPMKGRVNPMDLEATAKRNELSLFDERPPESDPKKTDRAQGNAFLSATPTGDVAREVIRAQIAAKYRRFLSDAARQSLVKTGSLDALPPGADLIDSHFKTRVDNLVKRIYAQYEMAMDGGHPAAKERIEKMWEEQITTTKAVVRDGVPDAYLTEICNEAITQDAARSGSPFEGVAAEFRADADKPFDADHFEKIARHIGR